MKIIRIILILLVLVIVGELIFYYYLTTNSKNVTIVPENSTPAVVEPTQPHRTDEVPHTSFTPALPGKAIEWLSRMRENAHVQSLLHQQSKGTIYKIQRMKYETELGPLTGYNILLTTNGITDEYKMNIYPFTDNQMDVVTVLDNRNGPDTPIQLTDLQEGDTIKIFTVSDLSLPFGSYLIEATITRTEQ